MDNAQQDAIDELYNTLAQIKRGATQPANPEKVDYDAIKGAYDYGTNWNTNGDGTPVPDWGDVLRKEKDWKGSDSSFSSSDVEIVKNNLKSWNEKKANEFTDKVKKDKDYIDSHFDTLYEYEGTNTKYGDIIQDYYNGMDSDKDKIKNEINKRIKKAAISDRVVYYEEQRITQLIWWNRYILTPIYFILVIILAYKLFFTTNYYSDKSISFRWRFIILLSILYFLYFKELFLFILSYIKLFINKFIPVDVYERLGEQNHENPTFDWQRPPDARDELSQAFSRTTPQNTGVDPESGSSDDNKEENPTTEAAKRTSKENQHIVPTRCASWK